jgi:hypothetical protein
MGLRRSLAVVLSALAVGAVASTVARAGQTPERMVAYETISGRYFVKNTVPVRARTFFIIRDFATFESIFGYGAVMGPPPRRVVSAGDFTSRTMLVAIASGPLCTLAATGVNAAGHTYTVDFKSHCDAPGSARYSVPLILSVPGRAVGSVTFVENGRVAGDVH